MNRTLLLLPFLFLLSAAAFAQTIRGGVTDGKTGEGLPFVNIGVLGKAVGTVSNEQGQYQLGFAESMAGDTVRISTLGYRTLNLTLRQLREQPSLVLSPAPVALAEVQVSAKNLFRRSRQLGFAGDNDNTTLVLNSKNLGAQMGTVIYLKHKPTKILSASFNVAYNRAGKLTFRLNLYRLDAKGRPTDQKLLQRDVVVTTDLQKGPITFDLSADKLILDENFFLSLEWVGGANAAEVNKGLAFSAGLGYANNDIYFREVSQDGWERMAVGALLAGMQPKLAFYVKVQD